MIIDSLLDVVHVLLFALAIVLAVITAVLLVEVLASLRPLKCNFPRAEKTPCSYVVVIPAHDEVGTIEETLAVALDDVDDCGQVLVVADNCTDATAGVAAAAGANVIERQDPTRRGKGFALDFAIRHLAQHAPEVVVVLDADCKPAAGTIRQLVATCHRTGRPVQARYDLVRPDNVDGIIARVGAFAWRVKNWVRPAGLANLGLPCHLMGTGMALPWSDVMNGRLESDHLVEDMVLGLELTAQGSGPVFVPDARIVSALPPSIDGQMSQRTRWETGHLQVIFGIVPRAMVQALYNRKPALFALALDTAIPPLALHALLLIATTVIAGLVAVIGGSPAALAVILGANVAAAIALAVAWYKAGRDLLSVRDLAILPAYVACKIPLYARAMAGSRVQWKRTKRS